LTVTENGAVKIWSIKTGELTKTIQARVYDVSCVKLLQDGNVSLGSSDDSISIWNLNSGVMINKLNADEQHSGKVTQLELLSNGNLACLREDRQTDTLDVLNIQDGTLVRLATIPMPRLPVILALPNQQLAVSSFYTGQITILDSNTTNTVKTFQSDEAGTYWLVLLNQTNLASNHGKRIKIWDFTSGELLKTLDELHPEIGRIEELNMPILFKNDILASESFFLFLL
jgi:WD40 repeat protein